MNTTSSASRVELMRREIPGPGVQGAVMFLISLPPGASAPVHTHPGIGVGYVFEGIYESQYEGEPLQRFTAGDAIYDLAQTPHLIARNGSATLPLRFVMTFIVAKGQPTLLVQSAAPAADGHCHVVHLYVDPFRPGSIQGTSRIFQHSTVPHTTKLHATHFGNGKSGYLC